MGTVFSIGSSPKRYSYSIQSQLRVEPSKLLLVLLVSGPVGTYDHIFVLSRLLRVLKWDFLFEERRGVTTFDHFSSAESCSEECEDIWSKGLAARQLPARKDVSRRGRC
jgi:hypothetical protein